MAERRHGSEWLTGSHSVGEALRARRRRLDELWLRADGGPAHPHLEAVAGTAGVPILKRSVEQLRLAGVEDARAALRCGPYPYLDEATLPGADEDQFVVVLDQVQDPQNLGAICRTAEAAGVTALCLPLRRASPVTPAVVRASAGATEHLRIHRVGNLNRLLETLKKLGYWVVGLEPTSSQSWHEVDLSVPVALVAGAEGRGLRRLVAERCDLRVHLPMAGRVASLNVNAAFAAVAYEVVRQRSRRLAKGG